MEAQHQEDDAGFLAPDDNSTNWPLIVPVIDQADALLCTFPGALPCLVSTNGVAGQQMVALAALLDPYNSGGSAPGSGG